MNTETKWFGEDLRQRCGAARKVEIIPQYSTDEFLRRMWLTFAKEDAPLEVFDLDLNVTAYEHQVLSDSLSARMNYQASIGYDRKETYTQYVDYYENEPYYENGVRKTRSVKKQRAETRERTVTDWRYETDGRHNVKSDVLLDNTLERKTDIKRYVSCRDTTPKEFFSTVSREKAAGMTVSDECITKAYNAHVKTLKNDLIKALPGDRHRDLTYQIIGVSEARTNLCSFQEYEATLCLGNKTYSWSTYPFGEDMTKGKKIPNKDSLKKVTSRMSGDTLSRLEPSTRNLWYITTLLLVTLLITSMVLKNPLIAVGAIIISIFPYWYVGGKEKEVRPDVEADIAKYTLEYKAKQLELLNKKLVALGMEPVTEADQEQWFAEADSKKIK